MAEEQIDKLSIEIESVDGDTKALERARKQLEKLGKIDLSNTIRQIGNLRVALGSLASVDDSVKLMLDNMTKLGLRASGVSNVAKQLKGVRKEARQTKEEIAKVIDESLSKKPQAHPDYGMYAEPNVIHNKGKGNYGYNKDAVSYIEKYGKSLDNVDKVTKKATKSTSKLAAAFGRIVRFRLVATVMQTIINSTKEGITALGEFDSEFKDTLNTYSASNKAIGGGVASSIAPALEALVPLVEYLANGTAGIGNTVSAIGAFLKDGINASYQAVKPVSKIKEEIAAAEKNVRKLISGFDELNIYEKNSATNGIDIYETKNVGEDFLDDASSAATLVSALGALGVAAAALRGKFLSKNKTLEKQTDLTKKDSDATVDLGDAAYAAIPLIGLLGEKIGNLGGAKLPALDPGVVTVPVGEAGDAVTAFETKISGLPTVFTDAFDKIKNAWTDFIGFFDKDGENVVAPPATSPIGKPNTIVKPVLAPETEPNTAPSVSLGGGEIIIPKPLVDVADIATNGILGGLFKENNSSSLGRGIAGGIATGLLGVALGFLGKHSSNVKTGTYAAGGIVSSGQIFMARENGIPEYVGSFGGQTGVANNEQITSGIASAVENVMSAYVPQIIHAIETNSTQVNIGDDQIARSAARGASSYRVRTGKALFV